MTTPASYGEVRQVAELVDAESAAGAVEHARAAAAVDVTPPPPDPRSAARDGAMLSRARSYVIGWSARAAGKAPPEPDAMDPTVAIERCGWMAADVAAAAGLDPRQIDPFGAAEELARRIGVLVRAAQESQRLHAALNEATSALEQYAGPLVMQAKAMMPDKVDVIEAGDAGRLAVRTLASINTAMR